MAGVFPRILTDFGGLVPYQGNPGILSELLFKLIDLHKQVILLHYSSIQLSLNWILYRAIDDTVLVFLILSEIKVTSWAVSTPALLSKLNILLLQTVIVRLGRHYAAVLSYTCFALRRDRSIGVVLSAFFIVHWGLRCAHGIVSCVEIWVMVGHIEFCLVAVLLKNSREAVCVAVRATLSQGMRNAFGHEVTKIKIWLMLSLSSIIVEQLLTLHVWVGQGCLQIWYNFIKSDSFSCLLIWIFYRPVAKGLLNVTLNTTFLWGIRGKFMTLVANISLFTWVMGSCNSWIKFRATPHCAFCKLRHLLIDPTWFASSATLVDYVERWS